jgi:hypothetical protein
MIPGEYLVNHGRASFLGRFVNRSGIAFERGDSVVLQTARGLETGIVLSEPAQGFSHLVGVPSGDLLRAMTGDDLKREAECLILAQELLADAQARVDDFGHLASFLDVEVLLDGERAILHVLPFADTDLSPLAASLAERHRLSVQFLDLRQVPAKEAESCGKPGCGSSAGGCNSCGTGGGCSTGSCSKGSVKNADELTAQFVRLRKEMENHFGRVPLHG